MEENESTAHRELKRLLLIARIWSAVLIAIGLMIFGSYAYNYFETGVADPYAAPGYPFIENLPPAFIMVSLFGLALAWKWKLAGGAIAIAFCVANFIIYFVHWPLSENLNYLLAPYGVNLLILIPGVIFVSYWLRSYKTKK